ncbi:MAG: MFS transporter [Pseudomonadota bacterium]
MKTTKLIAFGALALPLAGVTMPITAFIPAFYAGQMGLSLGTIGIALMVLRMADVFVDLGIGYFSDTTKTKYGRRRPWIAVGVVLLLPAVWMSYIPMGGADIRYLLIWVGIAYLGWSLVNIPYSAWSAELSSEPTERRRIAGWREVGHLAGMFTALVVPFVTAFYGHGIDSVTMKWLAFVVCPLLVIGALLTLSIRETVDVKIEKLNWSSGLKFMAVNKPFRQFFLFSFFVYLSSAVMQATFVLYVTYYVASPTLAGPLFLGYFAAAIAATGPAVKISGRFGKHKTTAVSMGVWVLLFLAIALLPPQQPVLFGVCFVLSGVFAAAPLTLSPALLADVSDYATMKTGRQEAGQYFAIWNTIQKATSAIGVGVALPMLGVLGFNPQDVTNEGLQALRFVCLVIPVLPYVAASILIWNFPLTDRRQDIIRRRLLKTGAL